MDYKIYFKQYKTNLSLLALKNIERQQLNRDILESKEPSVKAQVITDMPICHGEDVSSVERFVVKSEERLEELNARLKVVDNDIFNLQCACNESEAYLNVLSNKERFIIEQFYIQDLEWELVANAYQCHYQQFRTIRILKDIRDCGLAKINILIDSNIQK